MRVTHGLGLELWLVLVSGSPVVAEPAAVSDSARVVLDQAIRSMGGEKALASVKGLRMETRGTYAFGPMRSPYTAQTLYVMPDRLRWRLDALGFQGAMGTAEDVAWSQMMGPAARVKGSAKKQFATWIATLQITLVRPLLSLEDAAISDGAITERDGQKVHRVHVVLAEGRAFELYFTTGDETFLCAFEGDMIQGDGRPGRMKVRLSEPRTFGGITVPAVVKTQVFVGDRLAETTEEETTSVEWNPEVEDDAFDKPETGLDVGTGRVEQVPETTGLALEHVGDRSGLGATIRCLMQACLDAGLMPAGAAVAVFLGDPTEAGDPAETRIEVVVPIVPVGPPPADLPGGARMRTLPAVEVAAMTALGPYGEADVQAWTRLRNWMRERGHESAGPVRVLFFHDPENTEEEDLVSEVQMPIGKP